MANPKTSTEATPKPHDDDDESPKAQPATKEQLAQRAAETGEAFVVENEGRVICRPPPNVPLHTLGLCVLGNVVAHVDGKSVTIKHGTPLRGLSPKIIDKLRGTRGVMVDRVPSPAEKAAQKAATALRA